MVRPRIKTLEIRDFRAFAGPENYVIDLAGKNLLVYGENGSGKSTIFKAFEGVFAVNWEANDLTEEFEWQANRFTPEADSGQSRIAITYDDGAAPAIWSRAGHPVMTIPADERVVNAAWANAILDYRSLLETNHDHGIDEINLFDVCVTYLLRDYVTDGRRLGEIWKGLQDKLLQPQLGEAQLQEINDDSKSFNEGLSEALTDVLPLVGPLLDRLGHGEIQVRSLAPSRVAYNNAKVKKNRAYTDQSVVAEIYFHDKYIDYPHLFLNEARLSALALAIYFAGRLRAEQQTINDMPRIMVLDDVLIGLDQSNRLPVLDVLNTEFSEWQIVLLTHDRVWFEMAKARLPKHGASAWRSIEMFEGVQPNGHPRPVIRPQDMDVFAANLNKAEDFLRDRADNAAAVHTRIAFEHCLKRFCERNGVPIAFQSNPKKLTTESLLNGLAAWIDRHHAGKKAALDPLLADARASRDVILNAYSHSTPVTLCRAEIQSAIDAVRALDAGLKAQLLDD